MTNHVKENPEFFIHGQLESLRWRFRWREIGKGFFQFLTAFLGLSLIFLLLEMLLWFPPWAKCSMLVVFSLVNGWAFFLFFLKPCFPLFFFHAPEDEALARQIGNTFPHIRDRLLNALQVYRKRIERKDQVSPVLASAALSEVASQIQHLDLRKAVPFRPFFSSLKILISVGILFLLFVLVAPGPIRQAFFRWSHPNTYFVPELPYPLIFKPGSIRILKGQDVEISVQSKGPLPRLSISLVLETPPKKKDIVSLRPPYRHRIKGVAESFRYFFKIGRYVSPRFFVEVLSPPEVRLLKVSLVPPSYTGLKKQVFDPNAGHVEALLGSRMELEIQATKEIAKATLVLASGKRIPMEVHGNKAKVHYTISSPDEYWIDLEDHLGLHNLHPIRYWIRVIPDQWPEIRIVSPGPRFDLDRTMRVPLRLEGEDDFGISKAGIGYTIVSPRLVPEDTFYFDLPISSRTSMHWNFPWDVRELELFPEDEVHYFAHVYDNDRFFGPKRFRTPTYILRFPSIEEIYKNMETAQKNQVDVLEETYENVEKFQKELERFSESMKTQSNVDWETQKALEKTINDHISLLENLDSLVHNMENFLQAMEQKNLLSLEALQKYQELQQLISEMNSPELLEALEKFQETLHSMDPQRIREALEKVQISEEDLLKSLERTISLFKKLLAEQKLDEWATRLKDMAEKQMEINKGLEEKKEVSSLAREEDLLTQEAKSLYQAIQNMDPELQKELKKSSVEMEAILDSLKEAALPEKLSGIHQSLRKNKKEEAFKEGQSAVQSMKSLQAMMESIRDQLRSQQKTAILNALDRISTQTIQLSQAQEALSHALEMRSISPSQTASRQYGMMSSVDQIADSLFGLSQKTFALSPKIGRALGEAKKAMKQSLEALSSGNSQQAIQSQKEAMAALNRTVIEIQNVMGDMANASSGVGLDMLLGQLGELGLEQLALHQKLTELLQKGQWSLGDQAGMARLAQTQEMVKKRLEQLKEMYGDKGNVLGNLDAIAKDMEEVIQELKQNKADQKTLERENRILSRLLDAAHALYQQDVGEKRKAKAGQDIFRIPIQREEKRKEIPIAVDPSREGYTIEYQELIRRYFERMRP